MNCKFGSNYLDILKNFGGKILQNYDVGELDVVNSISDRKKFLDVLFPESFKDKIDRFAIGKNFKHLGISRKDVTSLGKYHAELADILSDRFNYKNVTDSEEKAVNLDNINSMLKNWEETFGDFYANTDPIVNNPISRKITNTLFGSRSSTIKNYMYLINDLFEHYTSIPGFGENFFNLMFENLGRQVSKNLMSEDRFDRISLFMSSPREFIDKYGGNESLYYDMFQEKERTLIWALKHADSILPDEESAKFFNSQLRNSDDIESNLFSGDSLNIQNFVSARFIGLFAPELSQVSRKYVLDKLQGQSLVEDIGEVANIKVTKQLVESTLRKMKSHQNFRDMVDNNPNAYEYITGKFKTKEDRTNFYNSLSEDEKASVSKIYSRMSKSSSQRELNRQEQFIKDKLITSSLGKNLLAYVKAAKEFKQQQKFVEVKQQLKGTVPEDTINSRALEAAKNTGEFYDVNPNTLIENNETSKIIGQVKDLFVSLEEKHTDSYGNFNVKNFEDEIVKVSAQAKNIILMSHLLEDFGSWRALSTSNIFDSNDKSVFSLGIKGFLDYNLPSLIIPSSVVASRKYYNEDLKRLKLISEAVGNRSDIIPKLLDYKGSIEKTRKKNIRRFSDVFKSRNIAKLKKVQDSINSKRKNIREKINKTHEIIDNIEHGIISVDSKTGEKSKYLNYKNRYIANEDLINDYHSKRAKAVERLQTVREQLKFKLGNSLGISKISADEASKTSKDDLIKFEDIYNNQIKDLDDKINVATDRSKEFKKLLEKTAEGKHLNKMLDTRHKLYRKLDKINKTLTKVNSSYSDINSIAHKQAVEKMKSSKIYGKIFSDYRQNLRNLAAKVHDDFPDATEEEILDAIDNSLLGVNPLNPKYYSSGDLFWFNSNLSNSLVNFAGEHKDLKANLIDQFGSWITRPVIFIPKMSGVTTSKGVKLVDHYVAAEVNTRKPILQNGREVSFKDEQSIRDFVQGVHLAKIEESYWQKNQLGIALNIHPHNVAIKLFDEGGHPIKTVDKTRKISITQVDEEHVRNRQNRNEVLGIIDPADSRFSRDKRALNSMIDYFTKELGWIPSAHENKITLKFLPGKNGSLEIPSQLYEPTNSFVSFGNRILSRKRFTLRNVLAGRGQDLESYQAMYNMAQLEKKIAKQNVDPELIKDRPDLAVLMNVRRRKYTDEGINPNTRLTEKAKKVSYANKQLATAPFTSMVLDPNNGTLYMRFPKSIQQSAERYSNQARHYGDSPVIRYGAMIDDIFHSSDEVAIKQVHNKADKGYYPSWIRNTNTKRGMPVTSVGSKFIDWSRPVIGGKRREVFGKKGNLIKNYRFTNFMKDVAYVAEEAAKTKAERGIYVKVRSNGDLLIRPLIDHSPGKAVIVGKEYVKDLPLVSSMFKLMDQTIIDPSLNINEMIPRVYSHQSDWIDAFDKSTTDKLKKMGGRAIMTNLPNAVNYTLLIDPKITNSVVRNEIRALSDKLLGEKIDRYIEKHVKESQQIFDRLAHKYSVNTTSIDSFSKLQDSVNLGRSLEDINDLNKAITILQSFEDVDFMFLKPSSQLEARGADTSFFLRKFTVSDIKDTANREMYRSEVREHARKNELSNAESIKEFTEYENLMSTLASFPEVQQARHILDNPDKVKIESDFKNEVEHTKDDIFMSEPKTSSRARDMYSLMMRDKNKNIKEIDIPEPEKSEDILSEDDKFWYSRYDELDDIESADDSQPF